MTRTLAAQADRSQTLRVAAALAAVFALIATMLAWQVVAPATASANDANVLHAENFRRSTLAGTGWQLLDDACLTDATSGPYACDRDLAADAGLGTPVAGGDETGFLQLTDNWYNRRGGALYNTAVDAAAGLRIDFKQYQYGQPQGDGALRRVADGISFFLVDGQTNLTSVGALGGSLGYARRVASNDPGIEGGYLGIGLDTFGNYANPAHVGGTTCTADTSPDSNNTYWDTQGWNPASLANTNSIGLRGPVGNTTLEGYCLIANQKLDTHGQFGSSPTSWGQKSLWAELDDVVPSVADVEATARDVRIIITPNPNPTVTVEVDFTGTGTNYETVINEQALPEDLPAQFKFGFASSTGGATGSHLISDLRILGGPSAADATEVRNQGQSASFDLSDLVEEGVVPLQPEPYQLVDPADGNPTSATTVVVAEGTWTINRATGEVTYTPHTPGDVTEVSIDYVVTDQGWETGTGTLTVQYRPETGNESKTVSPGDTATFASSDLETVPGSGSITGYTLLHPTTGDPIASNTYTDAHGGVWTINPSTGQTTYVADANYRGPVPSIDYRVTDSNDHTADGTLSILMPPSAGDQTKSAAQGASVNFDPIADLIDEGSSSTLTVTLTNPDTPGGTTQTVAGEGTWTLNPANGQIAFAPQTGYSGAITPISYTVTDGNSLSDTGNLGVTYGPQTGDASETVEPGETATFAPSDLNTVPGSGSITGYTLLHPTTGDPIASNTYTDTHGGVWTINPTTGQTTYVADANYRGPVPSIDYRVTDANGQTADGTLSIVVGPAAGDQSVTITAGTPSATLIPIIVAGSDSNWTAELDDHDAGNPTTKTVPGEGVWVINPNTGQTVFTPEPGFTSQPTPVTYTVTDGNDLTDSGTLTVNINYPPVAPDDSVVVNPGETATLDPAITPGTSTDLSVALVGHDQNNPHRKTVPGQGVWEYHPGTGDFTFTPEQGFNGNPTPTDYTVTDANDLSDTGTLSVSVNVPPTAGDDTETVNTGETATLDPVITPGDDPDLDVSIDGHDQNNPHRKTVPGEGVWEYIPGTGEFTFTPDPALTGDPTPVTYTVTDGNDLSDSGNLTVHVNYPPVAPDDTEIVNPGETATLDPAITPGTSTNLTVVIDDAPGATPHELVVPGQGTWRYVPGSGNFTFTPEQGFTGNPDPITYTVTDGNDLSDTGTLNVLVNVPPTAGDDTETVNTGETATLDPIITPGNDPDLEVEIDGHDTGNPHRKTVPGEGVWEYIPGTGEFTFTPDPALTGDPTPVTYTVTDGNDLSDSGNLTVHVNYPPTAPDDSTTVNTGEEAVLTPPITPGTSTDLDIEIDGHDTGNPHRKMVPGEGVWTYDPDEEEFTFIPDPNLTGDPTPITYTVTDGNGLTDSGTLIVNVNYPPTGGDQTVTVNPGENATLDPVITPGTSTDLTVTLDGHDAGDPTTKTVPGEGVWTIDPDTGRTTFTPEPGFTDDPTPVTYTVTDGNDLTDSGTLTVRVNQPPTAIDQSKTTRPGTPVEFDPLEELTTPGTSTDLKVELLDPETGEPVPGNSVTIPGQGTWTVDPETGKVTFTPEEGFTGEAKLRYRVTDGNNLIDEAEFSVTVSAATDTGNEGDEDDPESDPEDNPDGDSGDEDELARTGATVTVTAIGALGLTLLGAGLVIVTRRRTA
ncbi:CshA-type fibril repeat-containing protein [Micrococcales bacterium KH10]|nr:CshA-type fibril repeat-containing protein [Micrococcales bacterium KH10]